MKSSFIRLLIGCIALVAPASADLTVFAAASTSDVLKEIAMKYKKSGGTDIYFNFASSGALARQIDAGAPADIYISANAKWMDWLDKKGRIDKASRFDMASNQLVMIAPEGSHLSFDENIPGRLAVGDFKSTPAGMYAKEALEYMEWLQTLKPQLVTGSSARTVLMYVERGEVAAGIVYVTDALASTNIEIVGTFPFESHSSIVYPAASCSKNEESRRFIDFLKTDDAKRLLKKFGFSEPPNSND